MASLSRSSSLPSQENQANATSDSYTLPLDPLFEALLHLPARELCRLRVVCRSWCNLTSDQLFINAHIAKHPGPVLLAKFQDDEGQIYVVNMSGNVVKKIAVPYGYQLVCTGLDLCMLTKMNRCRVLNPATGEFYALPKESQAAMRVNRKHCNLWDPYTSFAFGKIAATREYKVLRMFSWLYSGSYVQQQEQLFEIFTIISGGGAVNVEAQPRVMESPDDIFVDTDSAVIIDGVVYFLRNIIYDHYMDSCGLSTDVAPDCIASFDMEREQWRGRLQGPVCRNISMDDYEDLKEYCGKWHKFITISELKGSLALAYYRHFQFIMDIWSVADFQNDLWVKQYSIQTEPIIPDLVHDYSIRPVSVLQDGRLVILMSPTGTLLIFDPTMDITSGGVEMKQLDSVAMYTGSLLSLPLGIV